MGRLEHGARRKNQPRRYNGAVEAIPFQCRCCPRLGVVSEEDARSVLASRLLQSGLARDKAATLTDALIDLLRELDEKRAAKQYGSFSLTITVKSGEVELVHYGFERSVKC